MPKLGQPDSQDHGILPTLESRHSNIPPYQLPRVTYARTSVGTVDTPAASGGLPSLWTPDVQVTRTSQIVPGFTGEAKGFTPLLRAADRIVLQGRQPLVAAGMPMPSIGDDGSGSLLHMQMVRMLGLKLSIREGKCLRRVRPTSSRN